MAKKKKEDKPATDGEAAASAPEAAAIDGAVAETPKKGLPIKGILLNAGGVLAVGAAAAGAAYFLAPSGAACPAPSGAAEAKASGHETPKNIAFVTLEPLVVSLGPAAKSRYLKISVSIETTHGHEEALSALTPRIRDVLNSYLRAVDEEDLIRPAGMTRLRAQMLRRLQLVAPSEEISDVLITDFVLT